MSCRIASRSSLYSHRMRSKLLGLPDVHRVGDRLHRGARLEAARSQIRRHDVVDVGRRDEPRDRQPGALRHQPRRQVAEVAARRAERLHARPSGLTRAALRDRVEVVDHLRQQPADVHRVGRREPHARGAARYRRTPRCVSRWQSSKLPATAYARTLPSSAVEHRQLRFLRRADAAVGIQHDDARVGNAVKRVRDGAAGVARRRDQNRQRLVAACRATPSAAP